MQLHVRHETVEAGDRSGFFGVLDPSYIDTEVHVHGTMDKSAVVDEYFNDAPTIGLEDHEIEDRPGRCYVFDYLRPMLQRQHIVDIARLPVLFGAFQFIRVDVSPHAEPAPEGWPPLARPTPPVCRRAEAAWPLHPARTTQARKTQAPAAPAGHVAEFGQKPYPVCPTRALHARRYPGAASRVRVRVNFSLDCRRVLPATWPGRGLERGGIGDARVERRV